MQYSIGHDIESIRDRALKSILFKLEHHIISLEELCIGIFISNFNITL